MYKCKKCGNTKWFEIEFEHRRYGRAPAEWLEEYEEWEPDWGKSHEDDGDTTLFPKNNLTYIKCGSAQVEEVEPENEVQQRTKARGRTGRRETTTKAGE